MKPIDYLPSRREFVGTLSASAATLLAGITTTSFAAPADHKMVADAEDWFKKVKGKHRIIYDAPEPHAGFPIIWSWAFYQTNNQTGSPDTDLTAVVVLRHNGIPIAMEDRLWEKYKFGEVFKIDSTIQKLLLFGIRTLSRREQIFRFQASMAKKTSGTGCYVLCL